MSQTMSCRSCADVHGPEGPCACAPTHQVPPAKIAAIPDTYRFCATSNGRVLRPIPRRISLSAVPSPGVHSHSHFHFPHPQHHHHHRREHVHRRTRSDSRLIGTFAMDVLQDAENDILSKRMKHGDEEMGAMWVAPLNVTSVSLSPYQFREQRLANKPFDMSSLSAAIPGSAPDSGVARTPQREGDLGSELPGSPLVLKRPREGAGTSLCFDAMVRSAIKPIGTSSPLAARRVQEQLSGAHKHGPPLPE
eukprot:m.42807 g.42807  ORF g.42807 m.42807 type:complete len:249 (-) comp5743_c0_seq1:259-1005(-)